MKVLSFAYPDIELFGVCTDRLVIAEITAETQDEEGHPDEDEFSVLILLGKEEHLESLSSEQFKKAISAAKPSWMFDVRLHTCRKAGSSYQYRYRH